jgi:hypothetical protein
MSKRTFDQAMGSSSAQQISAGLTTTMEPVYYATNMVNIAIEDTNVDHGIPASFSQTRVLPIVGKTSRAEIAVESADIQTKSLPIFQPQVKLGNDINELIYEVGVTAQWRGSMLALPPDGTYIDTLIMDTGEEVIPPYNDSTVQDPYTLTGTQVQTFTNDTQAIGTLLDLYGLQKPVTLLPDLVTDYENSPTAPQFQQILPLPWQPLATSPYKTGTFNTQFTIANQSVWSSANGEPVKLFIFEASGSQQYAYILFASGLTQNMPAGVVYFQNASPNSCSIFFDSTTPATTVIAPGATYQIFYGGGINANWGCVQVTLTEARQTATDTTLNALFDYWSGTIRTIDATSSLYGHSEIASTCLTPVCVGSVSRKIKGCGDFQSNIEYPGKLVVPLDSTDGFEIGDRVRFFGMTDVNATNSLVTTVFGTVVDVISYNTLQSPSSSVSPALVVDYFPTWSSTTQTYDTGTNTITVTVNRASTFDYTNMYPGQRIRITGSALYTQEFYMIATITPPTTSPFSATFTCTVNVGTISGFAAANITLTASSAFTGGYVINQRVKDGGHIELLTNEYAFSPRVMYYSPGTTENSLQLETTFLTNVQNAGDAYNTGWFKGIGVGTGTTTENFPLNNVVVQINAIPNIPLSASNVGRWARFTSIINGYYRITTRTIEGGTTALFNLSPLNCPFSSDPGWGSLISFYQSSVTFNMQLAPNYYSFDTRPDLVVDNRNGNSVHELSFMRSIGLKPTTTLDTGKPTYPPTATTFSDTWDRAFTVDWSFSSYQNIKWTPQNTLSRLPQKPLKQQDFGASSNSSTYYNVYEINKFINGCVNPSIKNLYTDYTDDDDAGSPDILELKSLNTQLSLAFKGFQNTLIGLSPNSTSLVFVYGTTYQYGQTVVNTLSEGGSVYMATRQTRSSLPKTTSGNSDWMYLGPVPSFTTTEKYSALGFLTTNNATTTAFQVINPLGSEVLFYNYLPVQALYLDQYLDSPTTLFRLPPSIKTQPPKFYYDERALLLNWTLDNYGFATNQTPYADQTTSDVSILSFQRLSWGSKTGDEFLTFESNSPFKFLFDNFPAECISYEDSLQSLRGLNQYENGLSGAFPLIAYWVWDSTVVTQPTGQFFTIFQTAESFSSCMSPVESIVIVSENIPVSEQLNSPQYFVVDSSSSQTKTADATALTNKIIGEIFLPYLPFQSTRTVVKYEPFEMKFYTLLDTKAFKQLDYSLYYRHRITQQLVPLILTNYGSVNIKFVFRPTST